ncbi:MAG: hypothetical protein ACW960_05700 [Candidatus Thorarchaeota archaeon]|jgi:hypothetical protein
MDQLLRKAGALYKEREKIAVSALLIAGTVAFYLFYSPGIFDLAPPDWFPRGWIQGFEVVASFNTIGFILALALMVLAYSFWTWAFLPSPAAIYTMGVLRGILGPDAIIKQTIGKKFRVMLESGSHVDVSCRIKGPGGDWFHYQLTSSKMEGENLESIAFRHGMSFQDGYFTSHVSSEELHSRTLLLAKAMMLAGVN